MGWVKARYFVKELRGSGGRVPRLGFRLVVGGRASRLGFRAKSAAFGF